MESIKDPRETLFCEIASDLELISNDQIQSAIRPKPNNSVISRQLVVKDGLEALFHTVFFRWISLNDLHNSIRAYF